MSTFLGIICILIALVYGLGAIKQAFRRKAAPDKNKAAVVLFRRTGTSLFFVLIAAVLFHQSSVSPPQKASAKPSTSAASAKPMKVEIVPPPLPAAPKYNPTAILTKARKAYEQKNYKQAASLLADLHPSDASKPQARHLWTVTHRELDRQKRLAAISKRAGYAKDFEDLLLGAGFNATVRAQGPGKKTLYIETPLMSKSLVYQLTHPNAQAESDIADGQLSQAASDSNTDLVGQWSNLGFTHIIFTDGFGHTWHGKID